MDKPDFTRFYASTKNSIEGAKEYLQAHRIPMETAQALGLGFYDPSTMSEPRQILMETIESDPVQRPTLIVPFDGAYWVGIETDKGVTVRPKVDPNIQFGAILGWEELYELKRPVWLASNPSDWLALKASGACAVYVDKIAQRELWNRLNARPLSEAIICIPPDSSESTIESSWGLVDHIREAGVPATVPEIPEGWGGALKERMEKPEALEAFIVETEAAVKENRTTEHIAYDMGSAGALISGFRDRIYAADRADAIPTGIEALDTLLDGGLYPGLYILGAMSSIGKTSLILQMADTIAATDTDVLFFTAEQSSDELMAKSLSRITGETFGDMETGLTLTPREILRGSRIWADEPGKKTAFDDAVKKYAECAGHLWIIERDTERALEEAREMAKEANKEGDAPRPRSKWRNAGTRIGLDTIDRTIRRHIELRGTRPVVFIDYLQILQPQDDAGRKSDKQVMDLTISELRRMSKATEGGYNVPIIAISSLKRDAYYGPVELDSFKESGSIEYSSDVILALQPRDLKTGENVKSKDSNAKAYTDTYTDGVATEKELEIAILKNRMGKRGRLYLMFDAEIGRFYDSEIPKDKGGA